jgi:adenylate kinase family enzyme
VETYSPELAVPNDLATVEGYLQTDYLSEKSDLSELQRLANRVVAVFDRSFLDAAGTWPYELVHRCPVEEPLKLSFSTSAMIGFSLALATGSIRQSSLAPSIHGAALGEPTKEWQDLCTRTDAHIVSALDAVIKASARLVKSYKPPTDGRPVPDPNPPLVDSATFGPDDPFTLTWLLELLREASTPEHVAFREQLTEHARLLVRRVLKDPGTPVLQIKEDEAVENSFPLLRVLHLQRTLKRTPGVTGASDEALAKVKEHLLERVHLHLSESEIQDSGFDAADLVFSLEGWILSSSFEPDLAVIDRAFSVLTETQARTSYWRPLRPFKATAQGLILLPQSVEVANSLLRIFSTAGLDARGYFTTHLALLGQYTKWLQGRVYEGVARQGKRRRLEFVGWESEHTYGLDRVHLWQTSQALIYLQHYIAFLQQHVARRLLRLASFVPTPKALDPQPKRLAEWNKWRKSEPLLGTVTDGPYLVYNTIHEAFVQPRVAGGNGGPAYSMLLYGPPGTGKSTIAKKLTQALGFSMITVTPSDFIAAGGEAVEARAKAIFQVLAEQRDLVVLFDEIDQLLLDRDGSFYAGQGDLFKLLTPGMLTKLNRLAENKTVVFVIATNYYERIDRAIKRVGRIDRRLLVLPPNLAQRTRFLARKLDTWSSLSKRSRTQVARATVHSTYRELEELVAQVGSRKPLPRGKPLSDRILEAIQESPPLIRLEQYQPRLRSQDKFDDERPLEELTMVALLESEAERDLPDWVEEPIRDALKARLIRDAAVEDRVRSMLKTPPPKGH